MVWKFRTYVSSSGRNHVQESVDSATPVALTQFEVRLRYLKHQLPVDWSAPQAKKLSGVKDIYEIRFQADGVQWRPLGFFLDDESFVILVWANHKGRVYEPADSIKTAGKRRKQIVGGEASSVPLKINGEDV